MTIETDVLTNSDGQSVFIGGRWQGEETGASRAIESPIDGSLIGHIAWGSRKTAQAAIAAARKAQPAWARLSAWERAKLCRTMSDEISRNRAQLAELLTREQGKPIAEAAFEVDKGAQGFALAADLAKYLEGKTIPTEDPTKQVFTFYQPRGVYGVITPWNFPVNIPIEYLAPGIAAGNTIVWVPAPTTSLVAVALLRICETAGLPPGVINLVTGPGEEVGDELAINTGVDGIGFTGSAQTGRTISQRAAGKAQILELGGNGPVIVFDDSDIPAAAAGAARGAFTNAGQICSSSERILVRTSVYDAFAEAISSLANEIVLGDPRADGTTMGPLNNVKVAAKVAAHVTDSLERGAEALVGGSAALGFPSDLYFHPTVLAEVSTKALINQEETFGPVAPLIRFADEEEALEIACANRYGLTASIFTRDLKRAFRFIDALPTGIVNVNAPSTFWELHIPFGGASGKASGNSRIGGRHTLEAMCDLKTAIISLE